MHPGEGIANLTLLSLGEVIVLPIKYLEELRKIPDDIIRATEATEDVSKKKKKKKTDKVDICSF